MASNLLAKGYPLTVFDLREQPVKELEGLRAHGARSSREVAQRSETVIVMVPDSPDAIEVIMGKGGVFEGVKKGDTIIVCCTILPKVIREIHERALSQGVKVLDAPVSGGRAKAEAGTLSIMVGGEKKDYEDHLDILKAMGKNIFWAGPIGMGTVLKLVNNLILFVTVQGMCEGLLLGAKAGLDPKLMVEALQKSTAQCHALELMAPKILARDFSPSAPVRLTHKTAGLILSTGKDMGVPLPFTSLVHEMMGALKSSKGEDADISALITLLENMVGMEVRG